MFNHGVFAALYNLVNICQVMKVPLMKSYIFFATGPVNNVIIVRQQSCSDSQVLQSRKRMHLSMPPPLNKYIDSTDGELESQAVIVPQPTREPLDTGYCSSTVMKNQIKELQVSSVFIFYATLFDQ